MNSIFIIVVVLIVVIGLVYSFMSMHKIKKNGIETEAEVSRIDIEKTENIDENNNINVETTKHYYVKYKNEQDEIIESLLSNPKFGLKEGDIIKIKYLPENTKNVIRIK